MGIKSTHSVNLTIYNIFHIILTLLHYFLQIRYHIKTTKTTLS